MNKLSPHPSRDKFTITKDGAEVSQPWNRWFEEVRTKLNDLIAPAAGVVSTLWSSIDKSGSNLTDLETRNHNDLNSLNSGDYRHLKEVEKTELIGGENTELHHHNSDRIYSRNSAIMRI